MIHPKNNRSKAGLGLTESSFINLCLTSVVETGTVDPEVIYNMKMADIKRNGILEIKKPTITFDQIGGLDNIKQIINKDFINISKKYTLYINLLNLIKIYELELINNNIKYYLYPYSHIKLNNNRYFVIKNININSYLCLKDGYKHNFNIYIFNVNNKNVECYKKDLDTFINNNKNYKFVDYKCNKCLLLKNEILQTKVTNNDIINKITLTNDIITFYNIFSNKCPLDNYHIFKNNECSICKITYEQIFKKDEKAYLVVKSLKNFGDVPRGYRLK